MNNYVTHMAQDGLLLGYKPIVFNQRGIADIPMKVREFFIVEWNSHILEVRNRLILQKNRNTSDCMSYRNGLYLRVSTMGGFTV